jgi:hypothetical protein
MFAVWGDDLQAFAQAFDGGGVEVVAVEMAGQHQVEVVDADRRQRGQTGDGHVVLTGRGMSVHDEGR